MPRGVYSHKKTGPRGSKFSFGSPLEIAVREGISREGTLSKYSKLLSKQRRLENPVPKEFWKEYRFRVKTRVINLYGNECACCGETRFEFLTIDHVRNNGAEERKHAWASTIYRRLAVAGVRNPDYQLLCWNCNCAKGKYGYCPHNLDQKEIAS